MQDTSMSTAPTLLSFSVFRDLQESMASRFSVSRDSDDGVKETEMEEEVYEVPFINVFFGTAIFQGESWPWLWYTWRPLSSWTTDHEDFPISVPRGQGSFPALSGFLKRSGFPAGFLNIEDGEWRNPRRNFMKRYYHLDRIFGEIPRFHLGTSWKP
jgi:hypothetical protein